MRCAGIPDKTYMWRSEDELCRVGSLLLLCRLLGLNLGQHACIERDITCLSLGQHACTERDITC